MFGVFRMQLMFDVGHVHKMEEKQKETKSDHIHCNSNVSNRQQTAKIENSMAQAMEVLTPSSTKLFVP